MRYRVGKAPPLPRTRAALWFDKSTSYWFGSRRGGHWRNRTSWAGARKAAMACSEPG